MISKYFFEINKGHIYICNISPFFNIRKLKIILILFLNWIIFCNYNRTAGVLIGANGANIKALRDNTGVNAQISKNRTEAGERTVVLDGRIESKFKALRLIFEKIAVTNRDLKTENGSFVMKSINNIKNNNNRNNNICNNNNQNQGFDKSVNINLNELSFSMYQF